MKTFRRASDNHRNSIQVAVMSGITVSALFAVLSGSALALTKVNQQTVTLSSAAPGNITTDAGGNQQPAGSGSNGQKTSETFQFSIGASGNIGSIIFQYCTTPEPDTTCVSPTGFTAANVASIQNQSGWSSNNFAIDTVTPLSVSPHNCTGGLLGRTNCIAVRRIVPSNETVNQTITMSFGGQNNDFITNPTSTNQTFYVRMHIYSDIAYLNEVQYGVMATAVSQQLTINSSVAPFLFFCVGKTVASDCSSSQGNFFDFGILSPTKTDSTTSQFAVSSNSGNGVVVGVYGTTMTSGNIVIPELSTPTSSIVGTSQFGMNLTDNTVPLVGQAPQGVGTIAAPVNYSTANKFTFNSGDTVASAPGSTDFKTFTVSYIVNVSNNQAPGVYNTTLNYLCTATF